MGHRLYMQSRSKNNDVKNDVKLCTLNEGTSDEPNASLIADYITLPDNIFGSEFTHLFYEMVHFRPFVWLFLVLAVVILSVVYCHNKDVYKRQIKDISQYIHANLKIEESSNSENVQEQTQEKTQDKSSPEAIEEKKTQADVQQPKELSLIHI